jgi:hypothetical protein
MPLEIVLAWEPLEFRWCRLCGFELRSESKQVSIDLFVIRAKVSLTMAVWAQRNAVPVPVALSDAKNMVNVKKTSIPPRVCARWPFAPILGSIDHRYSNFSISLHIRSVRLNCEQTQLVIWNDNSWCRRIGPQGP